MGRRVQCPRCDSQNTKFLLTTESDKLPHILSYLNHGLIYGDRLYECTDCELEWNRTTELMWRREFNEKKDRNTWMKSTFWEEYNGLFWSTWFWAKKYGEQERRMINVKGKKD